jgi:hypothetical protein
MATAFAYDPAFLEHDTGPAHPERPDRLRAIRSALEKSGLLARLKPVALTMPAAELHRWVAEVHAPEHVKLVADACREATGKTIAQWYSEFDATDALKLGRREIVNKIYVAHKDIWWATTLFVEYEKEKGVKKKDGLFEGYTICVTKSISAPVSKAYGVWTDPEHFAEMFGDGATQTVAEGGLIQCAGGCQGEFSRVRADKE